MVDRARKLSVRTATGGADKAKERALANEMVAIPPVVEPQALQPLARSHVPLMGSRQNTNRIDTHNKKSPAVGRGLVYRERRVNQSRKMPVPGNRMRRIRSSATRT